MLSENITLHFLCNGSHCLLKQEALILKGYFILQDTPPDEREAKFTIRRMGIAN